MRRRALAPGVVGSPMRNPRNRPADAERTYARRLVNADGPPDPVRDQLRAVLIREARRSDPCVERQASRAILEKGGRAWVVH